MKSFAATAALILLHFSAAAPASGETVEVRRVRAVMGTVLEIRAWGPDEAVVSGAITTAFDEVTRLDGIFSLYRPDSDLSRFNAAPAGRPVAVAPEIMALARRATGYFRLTEGAFDASVEPLARLKRRGGPWTAAEWRRGARDVGPAGLEIDENRGTITRLRRGAGLNFDGIAKGTALDAAADILIAAGASATRLNFGGQILAIGPQPAEPIEIADPVSGVPLASFRFDRGSVATSSQHERAGHVIDPRQRRIVQREGSVTVIASSAEEADALSTALLVLGPDDGEEILSANHPRAAALFVEKIPGGWRLTPTSRFPRDSLKLLHDDAQLTRPPTPTETINY